MSPSRSFLPISGYGLLSDCNSAALVGTDGSVDWLCLPRFDGPSVFGRILDHDAGHFSIRPTDDYEVVRRYLPGTLVLETTFTTAGGRVALLDALAFKKGQRGHELGLDAPHELLRSVRGLEGTVELALEFQPRPEYGLGRPFMRPTDTGLRTLGGPLRVDLKATTELSVVEEASATATFAIDAGADAGFAARWAQREFAPPEATSADRVSERIEDVAEGWRSWESEHDRYDGSHSELVRFSSRVLKGLTFRPTGAIVAAPTTSLPEAIGGERNWDYRFSWIRDASLTLEALWVGTCSDEVDNFITWMIGAAGGHSHREWPLQIMYGIAGERDLTERELPHLSGWRDSAPVRIGNGAWEQRQLDIYGEFLNAFCLYAERLGPLDDVVSHFLIDITDSAADHWRDPDAGMWEMRAQPRHHVSSKVLCWVAQDRAIRMAPHIGAEEHLERWETERDAIRSAVLSEGWSEERGAFVQSFGSKELDASVLLMPLVDFLPATDPRMEATIDAIARDLTEDGLVLRYRSHDGLKGDEGTFVICSFWLVSCLAMAGRVDEAESLFDRVAGYANDLGLIAEEVDAAGGELLGNFPQAFSHVGLIMAAYHLDRAKDTD